MTDSTSRGLTWGKASANKRQSSEFKTSLAVVIGIDRYSNGIPPLSTAVNDAQGLADILKGEEHGYEVILLTDEEAALSRLEKLFYKELPKKLTKDDRLLVYFAGHGVATDGDDGPAGFLIPQDAKREASSTFFPMTELHEALEKLPCRHMLAILDCCFAGAFRWSSKRDFQPLPPVIYKERYERFIRDAAWQVITSASYDQKALDILSGTMRGEQDARQGQQHSPFALALFDALGGAADTTPKDGDGVITATELYLYLRDKVEIPAEELAAHRQTPGLWPLNRHEHGEFIFLVPGHELNLPPAPELTEQNNPYKGLSPYEKGDSELFFGRTALVKKLKQRVAKLPFTVVLGASGTGKSSLVKAGLLPALEHNANNEKQSEEVKDTSQPSSWFILERVTEKDGKTKKEVMRPGANPLNTLRRLLINDLPGVRPERKGGATPAGMIRQWRKKNPGLKLLLVIDQFEELITLCREEQARKDFIRELRQALDKHSKVLRIVLTLRSDFEAQISQNYLKECWRQNYRFVVPPMTQDELREVIEEPASLRVLYFEPRNLVDDLINEVVQTPGSLPLLSFTLSELYRRYVKRQKDMEQQDGNRALTKADYEKMGGIIGSLRSRIEQKYNELDVAQKKTLRRILLRMVAFEGGELTRRQAPEWEFTYPDAEETKEVKELLKGLTKNRLIVVDERNDAKGDAEPYYEAVHDSLIVAWDKMFEWRDNEAEKMLLHRQLTRAAADWRRGENEKERKALLWDNSPRLLRVQEFLEQENFGDTEGSVKVERKQRSFRLLRQFCKNLCPSFKPLDRHVWLNRVETGFVRRSVERKRNRTRRVTGAIVAVILVLATATGIAVDRERKAQVARVEADKERKNAVKQEEIALSALASEEEQRKIAENALVESEKQKKKATESLAEANYNLAKAFEEKAINALEIVKDEGTEAYKKVVLFTSASLQQDINAQKSALKLNSAGRLFAAEVFQAALAEQWIADGHKGTVIGVSFSRDGKLLASATSSFYNIIPVSDINSGKVITWLEGHTDKVTSVSFSPNSNYLASSSRDKTIRLWDTKSGEEISVFKGHTSSVNSVSFSPDGNYLVSGSGDRTLRLWDIESNKELMAFIGHSSAVFDVSFNHDGSRLASASKDNTVRLWDAKNGQELRLFNGHTDDVWSVSFNPNGNILASASEDATIRLWDISSSKESTTLKGHSADVFSVAFSPDGTRLASSSWDDTIRLWDVEKGEELAVFKSNNSPIYCVSFSPDGRFLASGSSDRTVRLWNHAIGTKKTILKGHKDWVKSISFSPDGNQIASASMDNTIRLWDTESGEEISVFKGHASSVDSVAFSPDGTRLATGSFDHTVRLWQIPSGQQLSILRGHNDVVNSVAFSPDGSKLASASGFVDKSSSNHDNSIRLWDSNSGNELNVFQGGDIPIYNISFSPDGSKLASASEDHIVRLWDTSSGEQQASLKGHTAPADSVVFSPDGSTLASASQDNTVRVWDVTTRKEISVLEGHTSNVTSVSFSPDGKRLASASWDDTIRIWDIETGKELIRLIGHTKGVTSVSFSPNGSRIVSASKDKTVRLWDISLHTLFLKDSKPTPIYLNFIEALKFLWQLDVQGHEIVKTKRRTEEDMEKFGTLLDPPKKGETKINQVLNWAKKQKEIKDKERRKAAFVPLMPPLCVTAGPIRSAVIYITLFIVFQ